MVAVRRGDSTWGAPITAVTIVLAIVVAGFGFASGWGTGSSVESVMVTTDDVNLRVGPGTDYGVVVVIAAGTEVAVLGAEGDFASVRVDGRHGWMARAYLAEPSAVSYQPSSVSAAEYHEHESAVAPEPTAMPVLAQDQQVQAEGERWIEVDRSTRIVTLHDGEIIVARFDALIGKDPSPDGYYSTVIGSYRVWVKEKALTETPFAEGVYLTDFVGFDPDRHNGFHSPTRDADGDVVVTGGTQTLGCVRLSEANARFLFDFATIGMRVEVHD